jgi:predicted metal-dependent enzyme (double-stranded beta helix superfamily)
MSPATHPIHPALARLARAAEHQDFAELEETLHVALRKPTWLRPEHRVGDPGGYMRHLLYIDPKDAFVITAITWLPGQVSPIHGHQVWCLFGVAEGHLTEERFSVSLELEKKVVYRPGELARADLDQQGVHRVSNRDSGRVVSLHLYGVSADKLTTGINRAVN